MKSISEQEVYIKRTNGGLPKGRKVFRVIDLFCGAGGLTLGFTHHFGHNFVPVWANDVDESAVRTYNLNLGQHCVLGDIQNILKKPRLDIPSADVVIGGPPCQGFSLLNKKREGDVRNQLWRPFLKIVELSGASLFLMENVPQLLGSSEFVEIRQAAESMGFQIRENKLCAADYGVPQRRWRAFILGCRFKDPRDVFPPKKTHVNPDNGSTTIKIPGIDDYLSNPKPWRTVRDAIGDLPKPQGKEINLTCPPIDLHFGRTPTAVSLKRYRAIPKEGMNRFDLQRSAPELTPACWIRKKSGGTDLFGRLWWDKPAFTIRTEFFKPEKGRYLHPRDHRPITHREAARIQTFPDMFRFTGSKIEIARQIGNAVPPLLAARIADCIYALLVYREGKDG